jgi:hypothetical protein
MINFARKVGLFSSKSSSSTDKSSYTIALNINRGETYKTASKSKLKLCLPKCREALPGMKELAYTEEYV